VIEHLADFKVDCVLSPAVDGIYGQRKKWLHYIRESYSLFLYEREQYTNLPVPNSSKQSRVIVSQSECARVPPPLAIKELLTPSY